MHWMLNFVTEDKGFPAAILIRSLVPQTGISLMQERRNQSATNLTNGPAKIAQAFGINNSWNGYNICVANSKLFLEDDPLIKNMRTVYKPRKGIHNSAETWCLLPWNLSIQI
ncbi:MAG: hypothetical protein CL789_02950 [Chloroflexi bacterium]|nr:hypothetical protein [Chloroflexota bacterium]HCU81441.1 hypothetical protein [Chloroflexota bacterium]|tara:strand:+ start:824 stop:1159 length:336 start_codon:yes stop_codon:yes gene_type:complete